MTILIPDNININKKNYSNLLELSNNKQLCNFIFVEDYDSIKGLYGNYKDYKSNILSYYDNLKLLNCDELLEFDLYGINVFSLVKSELLSYLVTCSNWHSIRVVSSECLTKAYTENKEELLLNMSYGIFWIEFWVEYIKKQYKRINITHAIIFSGSLIYQNSLSKVLERTSIKVFKTEHFFTGNDYYLEEKYTPIANNSDIRFVNYYKILENYYKDLTLEEQNKLTKSAIDKIKRSNNKNVKQPKKVANRFFNDDKRIVLICGQVVNDFSIIERQYDINSIYVYKEIIKNVMQNTDFNVIFKAHPWERFKNNLKTSFTKDLMIEFLYKNNFNDRVKIIEDYNIYELFEISHAIIGISSQSLLEAAYLGYKPIVCGKSFFNNKGFTYEIDSIKDISNILKTKTFKLTLNEYHKVIEFFVLMLEFNLINVLDKNLTKIINRLNGVNVLEKKHVDNVIYIEKNIKKTESDDFRALFFKKLAYMYVENFNNHRKLKKLNKSPRLFFNDSKHFIVRCYGKIALKNKVNL